MLYERLEGSSAPGNSYPITKVNVLAMLLDQTMNTHFLSKLQWHTVLTGSTRIPVHPWNTVYHEP